MIYKLSTIQILKRLLNLLNEFKKQLIIAIILMIISVALLTYAPKLLGRIINQFLDVYDGVKAFSFFKVFDNLVSVTLIFSLGLFLEIPINRIMSKISEKNNYNLRVKLYEKLDTLSFDRFNNEYSGNIVARFNNDIPNIKLFISKIVVKFTTDALIILFTIIMIFSIDYRLSLIFACFIPIYVFIIYSSYIKTKDYYKQHQMYLGQIVGILGEYLPRRLMFHSFGVKKYLEGQVKYYNDKQKESFIKSRFYSEAFNPLNFLIINVLQIGLYIVAGYFMVDGSIDIGTFSSFVLYIQLFKRPVLTMGFTLNSIKLAFASLDRIFEILDLEDVDAEGGEKLVESNIKPEIDFKNVSFNDLSDFNLKVDSLENVNIVGDCDDFVNLLLVLKTPDDGNIYLGGEDIKQFNLKSYRSVFGVCLEDDWIISGTVEENIIYGRENIFKEDVIEVSKLIGLDEIVDKFPDKYETKLSGDFPNFSSGEAKLICLARALISKPKILVLSYSNYLSSDVLEKISCDKTAIFLSSDDLSDDLVDEVVHI